MRPRGIDVRSIKKVAPTCVTCKTGAISIVGAAVGVSVGVAVGVSVGVAVGVSVGVASSVVVLVAVGVGRGERVVLKNIGGAAEG